jgi:hypothetical protein
VKKSYGTCQTCNHREGSRCKKLGEYINLADWCRMHQEKHKGADILSDVKRPNETDKQDAGMRG